METGEVIKAEFQEEIGSMVLVNDQFKDFYASGTAAVARPLYNPEFLASMMIQNTYHARCIKQKAADTVGLGVNVLPITSDDKNPNKDNKAVLTDWIKNINPEFTFTEILDKMCVDLESIGYGAIEVVRNRAGKPARFNHIPAKTVRVKLDGTGIIQKIGIKEVHFKYFGDTELRNDPISGKPQTEVIILHNYSPLSDWYGIPDYIPAIGAMIGNVNVRDFNINFFDNNAVPQYAVVITGGEVSEDVENIIKEHFKRHIKGNANNHKTLVLTLPDGVKVDFKPLQSDIKDGHFRNYRIDNRDEVIAAHGVPPSRIGVAENGTGSKVGSTAGDATEIYKNAVIDQRQEKLEKRLNRVISDDKVGLGIKDWYVKFNEIDMNDEEKQSQIDDRRLKNGSELINEQRKRRGLPDVPWGNTPLTQDYLNLIGAGPNSAGGAKPGGEPQLDVTPKEKPDEKIVNLQTKPNTTMGKVQTNMTKQVVKKYVAGLMDGEDNAQ